MNIKQEIEKNPFWWILFFLIIGFISGIATYRSLLEITNQTTILKNSYIPIEELHSKYILKENCKEILSSKENINDDEFYFQCFNLGYDLNVYLGLLLGDQNNISENIKNVKIHQRNMINQRLKILNFTTNNEFLNSTNDQGYEIVLKQYKIFTDEISAKIQAMPKKYYVSYKYGKWLGSIVTLVSRGIGANKAGVEKHIGILTDEFDKDLKNFSEFNVTNEIKDRFFNINKELSILSNVGKIEDKDYYQISEDVLELLDEFDKKNTTH